MGSYWQSGEGSVGRSIFTFERREGRNRHESLTVAPLERGQKKKKNLTTN